MYGGMTLAGKFVCDAAGVDVSGGFRLDAKDFFSAWLYALVPIFGALVVHQVRFWFLVSASGLVTYLWRLPIEEGWWVG